MSLNYYKWMDLEVFHNYFTQGVGLSFRLIPFSSSTKKMKNFNILPRQQKNKIEFFGGTESTTAFDISAAFNGLNSLYFKLVVEDELFFNYTNLSFANNQSCFYLENRRNEESAGLFHTSPFVSNYDVLKIRPKSFMFQLPELEVKIEIKTKDGEIKFTDEQNGVVVTNYQFDLNSFEDDVYQLWINNELHDTFFMSDESFSSNLFGIVKINMAHIITEFNNPPQYQIKFNTRKVFWEYQIVLPKEGYFEVHEIAVKGIHNEIYTGPFYKELPNGGIAYVFASPNALQLQYQLPSTPILNMSYTNNSSAIKQLDIKLPNPGANQLTIHKQGEREGSFYASEIVYI